MSRDAGAGRAYLQILDAVILQRAGHPRILEERDAVLQPRAPQACHKNDRCGGNRILGASAVRAQNSSPPRGWCFTLEVCGVRTEMSFFFISGVVMTGAAGVGVAARVEEQRSVVRSVRLRHASFGSSLAPRPCRKSTCPAAECKRGGACAARRTRVGRRRECRWRSFLLRAPRLCHVRFRTSVSEVDTVDR